MAKKRRGWNEGSLHQRENGTWRAQILVNGKRLSYSGRTKGECIQWLHEMQVQLTRGWDYVGSLRTVGDFMENWLATYTTSLRKRTASEYVRLYKEYILPAFKNTALKDLQPQKLEQFYADLVARGVGIRTVRITHAVLHRALKTALRYGFLTSNPASGAILPRYTPAEMQVLDEEQVSRFLVSAHTSSNWALYHLAIVTGMRQGELRGLKWIDLKWQSGWLYVQRQIQNVIGEGWSFVEPKTRSGRRTIQLEENTLQLLRIQQEKQGLLRDVTGERWQEHGLMFASTVGTPLDPNNLRKDFARVLEAAGLPRIRFHDLRHTSASLMLNNGIPVIVVSKILGHSKPSITLDIYGHLYHEMQGPAAKLMDRLVTPIQVEIPARIETNPTGK